jgi:hypothetical protein
MIDIKTNSRMVAQLESLLLKARTGQLKALAITTIEINGSADAVVEMQPDAILIPAIIGSLHMLASDLHIAQRQEAARRTA